MKVWIVSDCMIEGGPDRIQSSPDCGFFKPLTILFSALGFASHPEDEIIFLDRCNMPSSPRKLTPALKRAEMSGHIPPIATLLSSIGNQIGLDDFYVTVNCFADGCVTNGWRWSKTVTVLP